MPRTTDVAIIGGGVIGCSIAYQLAKRGIKSTVFEKGRFAGGASGATAGIIGPLWYIDRTIPHYFRMGTRSFDMFPALFEELKQAGVDPEYWPTGILKVAFSHNTLHILKENLPWQSEWGAKWLDRQEMLEREPLLSHETLGGVFSPREGSVRGKAYVDSLVHAASVLGATFHEGVEVTGLEMEGGKVVGLRTQTETYHAKHTVIASGPWSGIAKRWIPEAIPVRPVKGQRILLRKVGFVPKSTVQAVVPQINGDLMVAATREEGVFDEFVTAGGIEQMVAAGAGVFPALREAEFVAARAGVRPGSPDGVPILGPIPGYDGLSIASGHDHAGIMLSPATGEYMADYIGEGDIKGVEPFSIARFAQGKAPVKQAAKTLFTNVTHER